MKYRIFVITLVLIFSVGELMAHPPQKPIIDYNKSNGELKISFKHPVNNSTKHYLDKVSIFIDGEEYKTIEYSEQTSLKGHEIVLNIEQLVVGTKIKVVASCNKMGKKSGKFVVK